MAAFRDLGLDPDREPEALKVQTAGGVGLAPNMALLTLGDQREDECALLPRVFFP